MEGRPYVNEYHDPSPVTSRQPDTKVPTLNFAIGPTCPLRCEGCYNFFGNTALRGHGLVSADEIVDFTQAAQAEGIEQVTFSGGEPLSHPEIVPMLAGMHALQIPRIKLDTTGLTLLDEQRILFKGRGVTPKVEAAAIAPYVHQTNIAVDGYKQKTIENFRRGHHHLLEETIVVASLLRVTGIPFGVNTVANRTNTDELEGIHHLIDEIGACEWQVFEYDPIGHNPTNRIPRLQLDDGQFNQLSAHLQLLSTPELPITCKSLGERNEVYFLIDDGGFVWKPGIRGTRELFGHITHERERALTALRRHIHSNK